MLLIGIPLLNFTSTQQPAIHALTAPSLLNTSALLFYNTVALPNSNGVTNEFLASTGTCWIDVRDLAAAHVISLEKESAGGERIIVSAGTSSLSI
jgi:nucleoside-diphosphate-sugar epimerase